ncbi:MAG: acyltransferase family protein [Kofleriaceae bacterium]
MPAPPVDKGFIPELDGLRGIAILMVMVHRFWPRTGTGIMADAAGAGWIGVDLFFVISGFLITGILLDTKDEPGYFKNFYARRVLRIFPLYYLFVGAVLIVFSGPEFNAHAGSPLWYLLYLGNVPESLLGHDVPYWLAPVWSLAIEEQFYLTFPWLVAAVSRKRLAQILVGMMIAAPLIRLGFMIALPSQERIQYLFTLCRIDTIAVGCLLAVAVRALDIQRDRARIAKFAGGVFAVAAVIAIATGLDRTSLFGRTLGYSVVAIGCASALSLVLFARDRAATVPLRWAWLRYFGKLCFGLYLLHRPADTIVGALADRVGIDHDVWLIPAKLAFALVLATISWHLLEKRFLALKDRFASRRHPSLAPPLVLASLLALLAACSSGPGATTRDASGDAASIDGATIDLIIEAGEDADTGDAYMGDPDAMLADGAVEQPGVPLYPEGARHSPITPALAMRLQAIHATQSHATDVFLKVGDSITSLPYFLRCFDGGPVDLGTHTDLSSTMSRYLAGRIGSDSPYNRTSYAAVGGTTASEAMTGSPSPLAREIATANGHVALVMFGTNEIRTGTSYEEMATGLWDVVDTLIASGVVPIMSTIPPLNDYAEADARIPTANSFVRAIAQGRGVPLVDFHRELLPLANRGIDADDVHPTYAPGGACLLTASGLAYGFNVRNLLSLEALSRVDAALAGSAPDATAPTRSGAGTTASPYLSSLPLASLGDSREGEANAPTCTATTGRAVTYRVDLSGSATITANVVDRAATDVVVEIADASGCRAAGTGTASAQVSGDVTIRVRGTSPSMDGEFLLVVR